MKKIFFMSQAYFAQRVLFHVKKKKHTQVSDASQPKCHKYNTLTSQSDKHVVKMK
jgi:hypothetical protein